MARSMAGSKGLLIVCCALGAIGVGIGALGAHGLKDYLVAQGFEEEVVAKKIDQCKTGVHYHMLHAIAVLALCSVPGFAQRRGLKIACWLLLGGVTLFSGGIYSLVYFDLLGHWAIIPSGGMLMILGWSVACVQFIFGTNMDSSQSQ